MNIEEDISSFMERLPATKNCCFCISLRSGTELISFLGIFFGLSCGAMFLIKDRQYLNFSTIILISLLTVFIIITIMFVIASVVLLVAACDENPDLMSCYIWLAGVYLCVQLLLAIAIPLVLALESIYPIVVALIWLATVMIVVLGFLLQNLAVLLKYWLSLALIELITTQYFRMLALVLGQSLITIKKSRKETAKQKDTERELPFLWINSLFPASTL